MVENHTQTQMATWWIADPRAADLLLGPEAPDWFELENAPHTKRIKKNALRSVYRTEISERAFFVKVYRQPHLPARFKRFFLGDPAHREVRASQYASRHNIAAPSFIAWAKSRTAKTSDLSLSVSPAIEHAESFADAFERCAADGAAPDRSARIALLDACAKLQARAHDGAFLHPDNHTKNVLVRAADDAPQCVFVDVYGARCGTTVNLNDAAKNLAPLGHWLMRRCSNSELAFALGRYCMYRNLFSTTGARRNWTRLVLKQIQAHAHRLYRKRDRRIGGSNAYFERIALAGEWRAHVTIRYRPIAQTTHRDTAPHDTSAIRQALNERIRDDFALAKGPLLIDRSDTERFFPNRPHDRILWRFGSPAWQRYRSSVMAMNRDLPCVVGWAYLEQRDGGSILQTAWIRRDPPNCMPLSSWLSHYEREPARRRVLDLIGVLLAHTFECGLVPRNLRQLPLVVTNAGGRPVVMWSGVEFTRVGKSAGVHARQYALSQAAAAGAWLSPSALARILRSYCHTARNGNWRALWRSLSESA